MSSTRLAPLVLLLSLPGLVSAQTAEPRWQLLESSPYADYRHDDASFVSDSEGWVVNLHGGIYHTDDGGQSWDLQFDGSEQEENVRFRSVGFVDSQVGWAGSLTRGKVLYETTDGGTTWTDISSRIQGAMPGGICGMWVVSENVIYAVGAYWGEPRFLKSVDRGRTWESTDMTDHARTLVGIHFWDENNGFILGGTNSELGDAYATVLMTEDGGATWSERFRSSEAGEWGWHFEFPSREVGYISIEYPEGTREDAKVAKTVDGGLTWSEMVIPGSTALQGVGFVSESTGWTSGRGTTSQTTDGGRTWTDVDVMDGSVNRFHVLNDTLAYAFGHRIYKWAPVRSEGGR